MRIGGTAITSFWALALLAACGDAVAVDPAARQAEDERRAAGRAADDAAAVKVRDDRRAAYDLSREAESRGNPSTANGTADRPPPPVEP